MNLFREMSSELLLRWRLLWQPPSREIYEDDYRCYKSGGLSFRNIADPVERARATFYRLQFCFGGKFRSGGFQVSFSDRKAIKELQRYANRLRAFAAMGRFWRNTVIEHLDYQDAIRIYGSSCEVVLYVDPPYMGSEAYYSRRFTKCDHVLLAGQLQTTQAPVVLSYYDEPLVRQLYPKGAWNYVRYSSTKNSSQRRGKKAKASELILVKRT